jgi:hypothetical protein
VYRLTETMARGSIMVESIGHFLRTVRPVPATALAIVLAGLAHATGAAAADIDILLDQAKLVKLPERVATVVIGNPLIADVTVQSGGLMVITGKGYGQTNVIALDGNGAVLMDKMVAVLGPQGDVVVVYRGVDRESYNCAPSCERRVTLGDNPAYFDAILSQGKNRSDQAQGAGRVEQK